jgi:hypothetical protein
MPAPPTTHTIDDKAIRQEPNMRPIRTLILATGLTLGAFAAHADHARPGIFGDLGAPPAKEDPTHGNTSTDLMIERCSAFLRSIRYDKEGHIRRYRHNYNSAFCIGWINSAMVFMNFRDKDGREMLGVCLPEGTHSVDVIKTFLDFAKEHADDRQYNPSFLIYWALLDKYPCKPQ